MIEEEVEDLEELGEDEPEQEQEMYEHFRLEVDPGQNLLRIDRFLVDRLPNVSRTKIQEAAEAQCVQVNNKPVKSKRHCHLDAPPPKTGNTGHTGRYSFKYRVRGRLSAGH